MGYSRRGPSGEGYPQEFHGGHGGAGLLWCNTDRNARLFDSQFGSAMREAFLIVLPIVVQLVTVISTIAIGFIFLGHQVGLI
jgi:hypothetical protein